MLSALRKVGKVCSYRNFTMSVFTQRLNWLSGKTVWELNAENYDYEVEIARAGFADMLHDDERNQKYYQAIKIAIEKMHSQGKQANVLDIGTGTGLLSMMAATCGADSIVACEAFAPMAACAQKIIDLNNFGGKIKVLEKYSTSLTVGEGRDLPQKANILVTEVFDTELIGEGALTVFFHAHKNLLESDCIVVPDSAVMYAQVVETTFADNWNRYKDIYSLDGKLLLQSPTDIKKCKGTLSVHDIQLSQLPSNSFKELISPQPIHQFDWSGKTPVKYERCNILNVKAKETGVAKAVFMWWELNMDQDKKIILSCAPEWAHPDKLENPTVEIPWRDHWMQAVYYLPEDMIVTKNQELKLVGLHDQFCLSFFLDNMETNKNYELFTCMCTYHILHSRTRIGQINDSVRNKKYLSIMEKNITSDSVVVVMGDGFYLGLAASKLGAKRVLCLCKSHLMISLHKDFIDINNLNNIDVYSSIETLRESEWIKDTNLVISEPYFYTTIMPWDGLHYAYMINELKGYIPESCVITPTTCSIKAVAVEYKDLQKIRKPLGQCCNFNMKPFDDLIMIACEICDPTVEPQPLWEYPCVARSEAVNIVNLSLEALFEDKIINTVAEFKVADFSECNGLAFWVEWNLDPECKSVISTGPTVPPKIGEVIQWDMHTKQGAHFFRPKFEGPIKCQFNLNVQEGLYKIHVD